MPETHYTAVLKVTKSEHPDAKTSQHPVRGAVQHAEKREVIDVASIVVRAKTLSDLRDRLAAHTALIEE